MATWIAFLRAINLGPTRKFPMSAVVAATETAGGTDIATHLATGNVRLSSTKRSAAAVAKALAAAYAADRCFDVPVVVFRASEVAEIARRGRELEDEHQPKGKHYVTLFPEPPSPAAARAVESLDLPGDRCVVAGRAAYALLGGDIHDSKLLRSREFRALGEGTARTLKVLEAVAQKWAE
jgi:uncharacterized protein (DUF1697 family)